MEPKPYAFILFPEFAEEFFTRCLEREAMTEKERIEILQELVNENKAKSLTKSETETKVKNKRVLVIKNKRKKRTE